jgi:hypothetical protein
MTHGKPRLWCNRIRVAGSIKLDTGFLRFTLNPSFSVL